MTTVNGNQVDGGCAKCHVGLGEKPTSEPVQSQLENIDCLICHSDTYKRKVEMVDGSFRFVPDTDNMTVTLMQKKALWSTWENERQSPFSLTFQREPP